MWKKHTLYDILVADRFKVEIGLLYDLPTAKSVATEPLTPDDWEILVNAFHILIDASLTFLSRNYMQTM
jgi:hypothetical protein